MYLIFKYLVDNISQPDLLPSCLFVVGDLNVFKSEIENKGYNINEGPKKWRDQVGALDNQLNCLDGDFRKALFYHNLYHIN